MGTLKLVEALSSISFFYFCYMVSQGANLHLSLKWSCVQILVSSGAWEERESTWSLKQGTMQCHLLCRWDGHQVFLIQANYIISNNVIQSTENGWVSSSSFLENFSVICSRVLWSLHTAKLYFRVDEIWVKGRRINPVSGQVQGITETLLFGSGCSVKFSLKAVWSG